MIYSYADERYYKFVTPFIQFALASNPLAYVEIILEDKEYFLANYDKQIHALKYYHGSFSFTQSKFRDADIWPNTIRFVQNPETVAKYLYITDIDILILNNLLDLHLPTMRKHNMFYSNVVRRNCNPRRMSGLHFIEYDKYFPLDVEKYNISGNDEAVLYSIMSQMHPDAINHAYDYRPAPGIHISLNRNPTSSMCWDYRGFAGHFYEFIKRPDFRDLYPLLDIEIKHLLLILDYLYSDKFPICTLYSLMYGINPSAIIPKYYEFNNYRKRDINIFASIIIKRFFDSCLSFIRTPHYLEVQQNYIEQLVINNDYTFAENLIKDISLVIPGNKARLEQELRKRSGERYRSDYILYLTIIKAKIVTKISRLKKVLGKLRSALFRKSKNRHTDNF